MILTNDLRAGRAILYENDIWIVKDFEHKAKGNWRSYMQTRLKNFRTGQIIDVRFNMGERIETPFIESKEYEYLYNEGEQLVCMDVETYDQIHVDKDVMGDLLRFLKPNERITCQIYEGKVIGVELPNVVELAVTDTPPVVKGSTATNQNKEATLETGAKVKVPPFIEIGEVLRIDTRSGEYLERAKK